MCTSPLLLAPLALLPSPLPLSRPSLSLSPPLLSSPRIPSRAVTLAPRAPHAICSAGAAVRGTVSSSAGFWQLLTAFTLGGLFFSSAIAIAGAVYAFGKDNVRRAFSLMLVVIRRVFALLGSVLQAARSALLSEVPSAMASADDTTAEKALKGWKRARARWMLFWMSLRWADAWAVLKEGFGEARRTAVEGVEAIRQEAEMYAAVVGPGGLVPLQYVLDRVTPLVLSSALSESLSAALSELKSSRVKKVQLKSFSAGEEPPRLLSARAYDLGELAMAFDVEIDWRSNLAAEIELTPTGVLGARVPIGVRNVVFSGTVRVILAPLTTQLPGFGAALVSLVSQPEVGLDVKVAGGEVTKLPWLRAELQKVIESSIADQLLWPRRLVIPAEAPPEKTASKGTPAASGRSASAAGTAAAVGKAVSHVLPPSTLAALQNDDPLLRLERALAERPNLRREGYLGVLRNATDAVKISLEEEARSNGPESGKVTGGRAKNGAGRSDAKRRSWPW